MIDKGHQRSYRYFSRVFQLAGIRKWDKVSCMGLRGEGLLVVRARPRGIAGVELRLEVESGSLG